MCLAVPGKVKEVEKDIAVVDFGGVHKRISLGVLNGVKKGDHVLVHAGFAIGKVGRKEAEDTFKALQELREAMKGESDRVGTGSRDA